MRLPFRATFSLRTLVFALSVGSGLGISTLLQVRKCERQWQSEQVALQQLEANITDYESATGSWGVLNAAVHTRHRDRVTVIRLQLPAESPFPREERCSALSTFRHLKSLDLIGAGRQIEYPMCARQLPALYDVGLRRCAFSVDNARDLATNPMLMRLEVDDASVEAGAVAMLGKCRELRWLYLRSVPLTAGDAAALSTLELEHLLVGETTDDAISRLKMMSSLEWLHVEGPRVTDAAILVLRAMPNLRRLALVHTLVTEHGRRALRELKPNLIIDRES